MLTVANTSSFAARFARRSLRKTPYRPRMAVLGSREKLCVNEDVKNKRPGEVNNACRIRVRETENYRRKKIRDEMNLRISPFGRANRDEDAVNDDDSYNDEQPPRRLATDEEGPGEGPPAGGEDNGTGNGNETKKACTCPHYRCLSSSRAAATASDNFSVRRSIVNSCTHGGELTKLGTHDIEDLVKYGRDSDTKHGVALYRKGEERFGMHLQQVRDQDERMYVRVDRVDEGSPADREFLAGGEEITAVGGVKGSLDDAVEAIKALKVGEPLVLDVKRKDSTDATACPYYVSQELSKHADIVFAPYNYVLDPGIRKAMGIDVSSAVVVLDEAHNVEDVLMESGSMHVDEIELAQLQIYLKSNANFDPKFGRPEEELKVVMGDYSNADGSFSHKSDKENMYEVIHELFLFLEMLMDSLRSQVKDFETDKRDRIYETRQGSSTGRSISEAKKEARFLKDDQLFECRYFGPGARCNDLRGGESCMGFFRQLCEGDELKTKQYFTELHLCACCFYEKFILEAKDNTAQKQCDRVMEIVSKFHLAAMEKDHFYVSSGAMANGSISVALGLEDDEGWGGRFRRRARPFPDFNTFVCNKCNNPRVNKNIMKRGKNLRDDAIVHFNSLNGQTTKWLGKISLRLLTPSILFEDLNRKCRSIILASGTLAPLMSFAAELGLKDNYEEKERQRLIDEGLKKPEDFGRLALKPFGPLEADHTIDLEKQLFACTIGFAPPHPDPVNGPNHCVNLTVKAANYKRDEFLYRLGDAIATVVECIPRGGVLVFLPSYALLKKVDICWNLSGSAGGVGEGEGKHIGTRLRRSKCSVIVESSGSPEEFEEARMNYKSTVDSRGSCVLFAVFRGKMSEGISFNDDYARGVICVGLPYPSAFAREVMSKKSYNDARRKAGNASLLPGMDWYTQQAYRALAQALGRCIRHHADYGTVVLMDARHCGEEGGPVMGDGTFRVHKNLPKWMRSSIRNLKQENETGSSTGSPSQRKATDFFILQQRSGAEIRGGWKGLKDEYKAFFREAKKKSEEVRGAATSEARRESVVHG